MMSIQYMFLILLYIIVILTISLWALRRRRRKKTIGIFHLYCSSGGGGERVLWHTVRILFKARDLFKIDLIADRTALERLEFVPLSLSPLIESKKYPFLTLLMQNLMSILVALQAAYHIMPEIYMETIGFSFTLPVFKLFGSKVITYVHYPTISCDMIHSVQTSKMPSFNNRRIFVKSPLMRQLKLVYYQAFALLYGFAGRCADLVMVNSSWTRDHIKSLWRVNTHVVYPPCDVNSFKTLTLDRFDDQSKSLNVISIAQFRPEKNHQIQIEAFDMFLSRAGSGNSRLTMYGGCRDAEDRKRVEYLRDLICRLDLTSRVSIIQNASFEELLEGVSSADVALHSMSNEHFGIVLLEFMAAGLITIAHNSGGPKADIIDDKRNGFLAKDVDDFAEKLVMISKMNADQKSKLRENAIKKADKFSVDNFEKNFLALTKNII